MICNFFHVQFYLIICEKFNVFKGMERSSFFQESRFLLTIYIKAINCSRKDLKLFSVCDMSDQFVKNYESEL